MHCYATAVAFILKEMLFKSPNVLFRFSEDNQLPFLNNKISKKKLMAASKLIGNCTFNTIVIHNHAASFTYQWSLY